MYYVKFENSNRKYKKKLKKYSRLFFYYIIIIETRSYNEQINLLLTFFKLPMWYVSISYF
jgi:hypothetical protein